MEFDKSRVYTALNADELKIGSKVIVADSIGKLQQKVNTVDYESVCEELTWIGGKDHEFRFCISGEAYLLAYLVEEPQQGVKWTDLKLGDLVCCRTTTSMVVAIDNYVAEEGNPPLRRHICLGHLGWIRDEQLKDWILVTKDKDNE